MSATSQQASPTRTTADVPRATYRVQLHADFRFSDATALVPYLAELGISHLYCLAAAAGPTGQHARLRRDRPWDAQSRARHA